MGLISDNGVNQGDLVDYLEDVRDLCNELRTKVDSLIGVATIAVATFTASTLDLNQ